MEVLINLVKLVEQKKNLNSLNGKELKNKI